MTKSLCAAKNFFYTFCTKQRYLMEVKMISPINFTGRAYFLDDALKTMTPEQKQRIEAYAQKKNEDTDVVVIGAEKESLYEYKGKTYTKNDVDTAWNSHGRKEYKIDTPKGDIRVPFYEMNIKTRPLPVYNAYIIHDYNRENVKIPHDTKRFDFREGAKSTLQDSSLRTYDDIEF